MNAYPKTISRRCLVIGCLLLPMLAATQAIAADATIQVTEAWVRATVPGQAVAGVYLKLRSDQAARLVGVDSPLAKKAEIHSMSNAGGVMRMRQLKAVDLPAGETKTFEPNGNHIMLFDITQQLKPGDKVPLTLTIEKKGKKVKVSVQADVRSLT
ncbi:MAG: copper chaperone PCu(A)C [Betaproteobacteria bacterium]